MDDVRYWAITPEDLVRQIVYAIDQPWGVTINDITLRPYRNIAEITADSAGDYSTLSTTVTDVDSTPDTNTGNDGT